MAYKVIIAEKYSVAKEIARIVGATAIKGNGVNGYLEGNGYRVTWASGHLVTLLSPEEMGYTQGEIPMFPDEWKTKIITVKGKDGKLSTDPLKKKQMDIIDGLFGQAEEIIVATDAGREGELIFRYIYEHLKCRTPFRRLWISSLTDEAIREGMKNLKPGREYEALSAAAHSRSEADWLVGFNASRALKKFSGAKMTLSLGRVQTPTLCMICQREYDNKHFTPTFFWQLGAETQKGQSPFTALSEQKYDSKDAAQEASGKVKADGSLKVTKVEKKKSSTKPPLLYDITSLQRAANSKYGLTAAETLEIAQELYEKKFTTYPRTGSRYIPEDVFRTIPDLLEKISKYDALGKFAAALKGKKLCKKSVDDSKVTDHHALLPTGVLPSGLSAMQQKVYDLICGRMIEAFGEDSISDVTDVAFTSAGMVFKAHGSVITHPGWKAVFGGETEDMKDDEQENSKLPELNEGEILPITDCKVLEKSDKAKPIYTDNTLLGEMETCGKKIDDEEAREAMKDVGLGTPATRAATIEILIKRGYIERQKKQLLPTDLGRQIWELVRGRKIADVKTTGEWERDLALVEQGKADASRFNDGIRRFVDEIIGDLKANTKPIAGYDPNEPQRTCPLCGKPMRNGKFSISCTDEGCGFRIYRELGGKKLPESAIKALAEGKETGLIKGFKSKSGKTFDARVGIDREKRGVTYIFDKEPEVKGMDGISCPFCGTEMKPDGKMLKCGCGFGIWMTVSGKALSKAQLISLFAGKEVEMKGLTSKAGKPFDAPLLFNRDTKKIEFNFKDKKK